MGDYAIKMQFDVAAEPDVVRRALETEDGITAWWSNHSTLAGSDLRVSFVDVPQPFEFEVGSREGRLEWVTGGFPPWWKGTTIAFDVAPNPDAPGTRLLFTHGGYDADNPVIPIVTPAWAQILLRLKAYAETGDRQPFFDF